MTPKGDFTLGRQMIKIKDNAKSPSTSDKSQHNLASTPTINALFTLEDKRFHWFPTSYVIIINEQRRVFAI